MRRASTTILSEQDFKSLVQSNVKQKQTFTVQVTREKNYYLYNEKERLVARGKKGKTKESKLKEFEDGASIFGNNVTFSQGLAVVTMVKQQVKSYIDEKKHPEVIEAKYSTTGRSHDNFKEIPNGSVFYSVDINHAYFQVLRKLNYISEEFYRIYKDQDHYKKAFHFSCSWLASRTKIYTYKMGVLVGVQDKAKSEKEFKQIYDNVRHTLQNLLGELYERIGTNAVAYLTDEIFIKKEALPEVKEFFKEKGYEFKTSLCWKINNTEFDKAHQKVHKLFGKNAEKAKETNQDAIGANGYEGITEVEKESNSRVRNIMRNRAAQQINSLSAKPTKAKVPSSATSVD